MPTWLQFGNAIPRLVPRDTRLGSLDMYALVELVAMHSLADGDSAAPLF